MKSFSCLLNISDDPPIRLYKVDYGKCYEEYITIWGEHLRIPYTTNGRTYFVGSKYLKEILHIRQVALTI